MSRVAAIALDAADVHVVLRLIDRGELPFLRSLRARSARYELRSDPVYRGTSLWEGFLAGREDVGHWAGGGFVFEPESYGSFQVGALGTVPFYERASGIAPIAIDVPHLSPSGSGVRVCCWGGHVLTSVRGSVPRGLLHEIVEHFGAHPAFRADQLYAWHRREYVESLGNALAVGARRRIEIAQWLQQRFGDWNLILVAMSEAHSAGENFGHTLDEAHPLASTSTAALAWQKLVDVYRALDDAVGRFAATLPQDTALLVFALHGMAINDADLPSQVLLPELLYRVQRGRSRLHDVDQQKWRQAGCPPVVPKSTVTWKQHMDSRWRGARPGRSASDASPDGSFPARCSTRDNATPNEEAEPSPARAPTPTRRIVAIGNSTARYQAGTESPGPSWAPSRSRPSPTPGSASISRGASVAASSPSTSTPRSAHRWTRGSGRPATPGPDALRSRTSARSEPMAHSTP